MSVVISGISKIYPTSFPRLKKFFKIPIKPAVEALRNISFEIENNEIFGLIGRNGAGKTTLTKIVATLVQPDGGTVTVNGYDSVKNEVRVRSLVGLATAEERSFYWRLTAEQNMMFFARLYGFKDRDARERIGDLFARLDLSKLARRNFSELSTGNKQKLAIARALLPSPLVLLLDEPTRSLDPLAAANLRELIASLENVSILLTSHNLSEIEELCGRVGVISNGEIKAIDTPQNLRRSHRQTQQVKITVAEIMPEALHSLFKTSHQNYQIDPADQYQVISFTRAADDRALGETIAALNNQGALILNVETSSPTLLDVLESYN